MPRGQNNQGGDLERLASGHVVGGTGRTPVPNTGRGYPRSPAETELEHTVSEYVKLGISVALDVASTVAGFLQYPFPVAGDIATVILGGASAAYIKKAYDDNIMAAVALGEQFPVIGRFAWLIPSCTIAHFRYYNSEKLPPFLRIGAKKHEPQKALNPQQPPSRGYDFMPR
ncbi:hypothetical protein HYV82_02905 [Candidatus Woesearchaeota archaeon]|nr:hypothetical protein [Candidatus Woesearchaeota archaeon]